jgi:hypothetical protein
LEAAGAEARHRLLRHGLGLGRPARPRFLDLRRQEVDAPLQLGQPVSVGARRLEARHLRLKGLDLLAQLLGRRVLRRRGQPRAGHDQDENGQGAAPRAASQSPQNPLPDEIENEFHFQYSGDDTSAGAPLSNTCPPLGVKIGPGMLGALGVLLLVAAAERPFTEERELLDRRLETLRRILPDGANPGSDVALVTDLAHGARLMGLEVLPRGPVENGARGDVPLELSAVGSYSEIDRFFRLVALSPRLIDVDHLALTAAPDGPVKVTALLRVPFRPAAAAVPPPPEGFRPPRSHRAPAPGRRVRPRPDAGRAEVRDHRHHPEGASEPRGCSSPRWRRLCASGP